MRVFLSFNSKDEIIAESIKSKLQATEPSLDIFFSPVSLGSGFWLPKLAEGIRDCDAFLLLFGPGGVGPWQVIEYFEAFDRRAKDPRFALVPLVVGGAAVPGLPFLRQLNWAEMPQIADDCALSRLIGMLQGDEPAGDGGSSSPALWKIVQPYRGLEAMTEANADYFYGRGAETTLVLDSLASRPDRLSLLIGASGVGKSSIARAGVLSALKAMHWPDVESARPWPAAFRDSRQSWAFLVVRPGHAPLRALASAFVRLWHPDNPTDTDRWDLVERWNERLRKGSTALLDLLDATQEALERRDSVTPGRILIYLDQAEELYTRGLGGAGTEAARFAEQFGATLADPRLLAFGSLRADYFDRLQADTPLFERYEHVDVPPMRAEQIAEVVAGPAQALGVRFEDERLCGRIVEAAASAPGQLPLLAYLLTDMWSAMVARADGRLRLPLGAIDLGGVLAARAEQFLADNPGEEPWVKRLFTLRLALVSPEGMTVRRTTPRSECDPREWALVERFADYPWRLVVARERDAARGEPMAELAHEALLKAWPRLEAWLRDERDFLVFKAEVERAERRWRDKGEAALLGGLDLASAESWLTLRSLDLSPDSRAFIGRSVLTDRQHKERALRIQRRVSAGFAAAAVLLMGIGGWALWEKADAEAQKREADRLRIEATDDTRRVEENARRADAAAALANDNASHAQAERKRSDRMLANIAFLLVHPLISANKTKQNEDAISTIETEAAGGDPEAMYILGVLYIKGVGVPMDYGKALDWYQKAAGLGNAIAMESLGLLYAAGEGVPRDVGKALEWFQKAAFSGDAGAMREIGSDYYDGQGVPKDYAKAMYWYRKAAMAGDVVALRDVGILYDNGRGVPQSYAVAVGWYLKAAAGGDVIAMRYIGDFYRNGQGVKQDNAQALDWYRKAADAGDATAMRYVGEFFDDGDGVKQDYAEAMRWYSKAAGLGDGAAMRDIGILYDDGNGVPQDYAQAMDWYRKAADAGDSVAMRDIGLLYDYAHGVPRDVARALEWYGKAAERGDATAANNIGAIYVNGEGVPRDDAVALQWYRKGAELGDLFAMRNIGMFYANGRGVPRDYAQALAWFKKAADHGDVGAMLSIGDFYHQGRGVPRDDAKALEWYLKANAAAPDDPGTLRAVGILYEEGQPGVQDYAKAREWFGKAADRKDAIAMRYIAELYQKGLGVQADPASAADWYLNAANLGDATAMRELGMLYDNGQGVAQSYLVAMGYYRKAAAAGDITAMRYIGDFYRHGQGGVKQDYAQALDWYRKAADAGDAIAMRYVGEFFDDGDGVKQDYAEAMRWYSKAAGLGDGPAMRDIGILYDGGNGVPQDYAQAMDWYRKAADAGDSVAMRDIGLLYDDGHGVPQDPAKAMEWYRKAADAGDAAAMSDIGNLFSSGRGVPQDYPQARDWYQKAVAAGRTSSLGSLSWADLMLRDFTGALEAAEQGHKLLPNALWIETNHAHALMFLGRPAEALAIYMAHVDQKVADNGDKPWQQVILDDFAYLRAAGLFNPLMDDVERRFKQQTP